MEQSVRDMGPLRVWRDPLIGEAQSVRIHELAKRILQEVGLEVRHDGALATAHRNGLRIEGERVFFEPGIVDEYVAEERRLSEARCAAAVEKEADDDGRLSLFASSYALNLHDVETGRVEPFTTHSLIEMTKLIDSLADEAVFGAPPGIPGDVPPDLQPLAQYRIAATTSRLGATPVDPTSARTVNHLLDMAEVMERPITSLPIYVVSPLRLGGESLDVVLACIDRLTYVRVSSMPATGATAPVHPFGALALAAAESIGSAIVVQLHTGKRTAFGGVGIFPFDLRAGAMVFGSPENMLYQMLMADFNTIYGGRPDRGPGNTHVMSKLPDCQSATDKAAIMALGAFMGTRHFGAVGTLSLDEIFSPIQLLVDVEIRNWVERALKGVWLGEEAVEDWVAEIKAGVERSFMELDSTLDNYMRHMWYPERHERGAIGSWRARGEPRLSDRLAVEVRRRIAAHDFELDRARRDALEGIYRRAQEALAR